jgi:hypothetical protein
MGWKWDALSVGPQTRRGEKEWSHEDAIASLVYRKATRRIQFGSLARTRRIAVDALVVGIDGQVPVSHGPPLLLKTLGADPQAFALARFNYGTQSGGEVLNASTRPFVVDL